MGYEVAYANDKDGSDNGVVVSVLDHHPSCLGFDSHCEQQKLSGF